MRMVNIAKNKMMKISRDQKLRQFYSFYKEGMTVLDVGVSSESGAKLAALNYFVKHFRYDPKYYTGLGIQNLSGMDVLFPGKRFIQYPGGTFPFRDDAYDWVFSNAVIEHVGDDKAQLHFINEMLRVAKNVFFTTPNKYFPVESHTNLLFLHWNNALFYKWCRTHGRRTDNLYLFSYRRLKSLLDRSKASIYTIHKNRTLGIPMTFTVIGQSSIKSVHPADVENQAVPV